MKSRAIGRRDAALGAADWLCLAAAPTFAVMALVTGVLGEAGGTTCLGLEGALPLGGMPVMYLLMSAFHLTPWLKLACLGPSSRMKAKEAITMTGRRQIPRRTSFRS